MSVLGKYVRLLGIQFVSLMKRVVWTLDLSLRLMILLCYTFVGSFYLVRSNGQFFALAELAS
jgi:hypothetical protein